MTKWQKFIAVLIILNAILYFFKVVTGVEKAKHDCKIRPWTCNR